MSKPDERSESDGVGALPGWVGGGFAAAAVLAIAAWSAWHRWTFLSASPYPLGIDGYFYAVQLRSILESGHLHYPASPLGFWLMAPFAAATDPIVGAKLGAAVLGAAIAIPSYFVGRRLGGGRVPGVVAAGLATTSAGSFYLSLEFVKNGIGLPVALTYVWMLLRALERPTRGRVVAAALALVAAVLTHKMAAALAVAVSIPAIAVEARARGVVGPWRVVASPWRLVGAGAVAAALAIAVLAVASMLLPGRFLGVRELALLDGLLTDQARWELPALAGRKSLWLRHEAAIGGVAALLLLGTLALRRWLRPPWLPATPMVRPAEVAVAVAMAAVALVVALPWLDVGDPQGLGFRLRIAAFVPMALVLATLTGVIAAAVPRRWSISALRPAVIAFTVFWAFSAPLGGEGVIRSHPAATAAMIALDGSVPDDAIVICPERHILFMAAWYTRRDVRLRPDGVPAKRRWRLTPLAFLGRGSIVDEMVKRARARPELAPPIGLHARHPNGIVVMPEATWQWVVDEVDRVEAAEHIERKLGPKLRAWPTI